jgi:hypothetical protein
MLSCAPSKMGITDPAIKSGTLVVEFGSVRAIRGNKPLEEPWDKGKHTVETGDKLSWYGEPLPKFQVSAESFPNIQVNAGS